MALIFQKSVANPITLCNYCFSHAFEFKYNEEQKLGMIPTNTVPLDPVEIWSLDVYLICKYIS